MKHSLQDLDVYSLNNSLIHELLNEMLIFSVGVCLFESYLSTEILLKSLSLASS